MSDGGAFSFRNHLPAGCGDLHQKHLLAPGRSYLREAGEYELAQLTHGEALLKQHRLGAAMRMARENPERASLLFGQVRHRGCGCTSRVRHPRLACRRRGSKV
jgi:hypothetical protein